MTIQLKRSLRTYVFNFPPVVELLILAHDPEEQAKIEFPHPVLFFPLLHRLTPRPPLPSRTMRDDGGDVVPERSTSLAPPRLNAMGSAAFLAARATRTTTTSETSGKADANITTP
jgi:hypothetical protein